MCGIVGYISKNNTDVVKKTIASLIKLQHRGQDGAGICFLKNGELEVNKGGGYIKEVLSDFNFKSSTAIAHTRYSTVGDIKKENLQPILYKNTALCHNGTIYNIDYFREILLKNGFSFDGNSDSEVVLKWLFYKLKKEANLWQKDEINEILSTDFKNSAYSILIMTKDKIFAFKDINSYRPLVFIETKEDYIVSSEDCILDKPYIKKFELSAKSALEISKEGYELIDEKPQKTQQCVFEAVYFSNPKSNIFNINAKNERIKLGRLLAKNDSIKADFIVPIMNSGYWGAVGYSLESGIELELLIKNQKNILRTFIENREKRERLSKEKYIIDDRIKDKKIILVDDSIVRGITSKNIIELLKQKKPKEIHLRLTSPMIINSCFWGVDIPNKNELLAYNLKSADNIKKELGIDSVRFISNSDFEKIFDKNIWCHKCFLN